MLRLPQDLPQIQTRTAQSGWDGLVAFLILEGVSFNVNQARYAGQQYGAEEFKPILVDHKSQRFLPSSK
jgi:hypothetical protein